MNYNMTHIIAKNELVQHLYTHATYVFDVPQFRCESESKHKHYKDIIWQFVCFIIIIQDATVDVSDKWQTSRHVRLLWASSG